MLDRAIYGVISIGMLLAWRWLRKLAWRIRIKMIVAVNKEVDSSNREDGKTRCIKTRRAVVVI
jgi:hypothetical protein